MWTSRELVRAAASSRVAGAVGSMFSGSSQSRLADSPSSQTESLAQPAYYASSGASAASAGWLEAVRSRARLSCRPSRAIMVMNCW